MVLKLEGFFSIVEFEVVRGLTSELLGLSGVFDVFNGRSIIGD